MELYAFLYTLPFTEAEITASNRNEFLCLFKARQFHNINFSLGISALTWRLSSVIIV